MSKALEKIEKLIGADAFKESMRELWSIIPEVVRRDIPDTLFYQNYLFSIDKGCGLSTALRYMGDMLTEAAIGEITVEETKAPASLKDYVPTPALFPKKKRYSIKCIDISEWLSRTDHPEFTGYLQILQKEADTTIFVFRVPQVGAEPLSSILDNLSDILYIKCVEFQPLGSAEMEEYAAGVAEKMGFTLDTGAYEMLSRRIAEEKSDGRFYGFNTVKKVVQEIVFKKLIANAEKSEAGSVIFSEDIGSMLSAPDAREKSEEMLSSLVGLEKVKKQVTEIIGQIEYLHAKSDVKMPCIHMRFVGNPGTGKTTVARIVGRMLSECGVLRNGGFYEYSGRSFVGKYIGETARKTEEICREAYGSVLFIDEAYSLFFSENDDRDFGREALSTLISEMENHRDDMVVIMAGYTDEMNTLMKGNPGLESRMPYVIEFDNYSKEELTDIFMKMAGSEFAVSEGLRGAVASYFESISASFFESKAFSNARFVRNLYERTQNKALNRCIREKANSVLITEADFAEALSDKEFSKATEGKKANIGF